MIPVKTQAYLLKKRFWPMFVLALLLMFCLSCQKFNETTTYKNANKLYIEEDYAGAIQKYQELTSGQFYQKEAWLNLGYCYLSLVRGALTEEESVVNSDKAIEAFKKYLQLNPSDEKIEDYIFNTYMDSRQYNKVLEFLYSKYEKNPQDIRAIQLIIQTYEDQGMIQEAIEWYRKRCEMTPDDPDAFYAFAVFYWRNSFYNQALDQALRATFVEEGIELIKQAVELNPEFADAYIYWNLLLREKAKYTKSKREQEKITEEANVLRDKGSAIRAAQQEKEAAEKTDEVQTEMSDQPADDQIAATPAEAETTLPDPGN
ncbi:hypothetical protein JXQ70_08580 [bacterium]|nr:hypothetical protein [bacterium]